MAHLRASQITGCSASFRLALQGPGTGENEDRLATVAAWREAPYFTDAERAALALTEAVTRLADRPEPVPDGVGRGRPALRRGRTRRAAAVDRHDNVFNRLDAPTGRIAGAWGWEGGRGACGAAARVARHRPQHPWLRAGNYFGVAASSATAFG